MTEQVALLAPSSLLLVPLPVAVAVVVVVVVLCYPHTTKINSVLLS